MISLGELVVFLATLFRLGFVLGLEDDGGEGCDEQEEDSHVAKI